MPWSFERHNFSWMASSTSGGGYLLRREYGYRAMESCFTTGVGGLSQVKLGIFKLHSDG